MPELPEVQTVVSELNRKLKNKIIKSVEVRRPKLVAIGPNTLAPKRTTESYQVIKFVKLLTGQRIISVKRRAKLLIFNLSPSPPLSPARGEGAEKGWSMLVHLKMTGQFIYEDEKLRKKIHGPFGSAQGRGEFNRSVEKYRLFNKLSAPPIQLPSKHTHVIFTFTDGSVLYYNDVRVFGYLKLVHNDDINQVAELKEFGPEPLSKNFTLLRFCAAAQKRSKSSIKQALMDAKVVAGIGNIYSDEILFHARVRPARKIASIKQQELKQIYQSIGPVLKKGIATKGSSVGDFVRTNGSWGKMGRYHFVYARGGQKCKRCATIIKAVKLGGRTASYCPKCQK